MTVQSEILDQLQSFKSNFRKTVLQVFTPHPQWEHKVPGCWGSVVQDFWRDFFKKICTVLIKEESWTDASLSSLAKKMRASREGLGEFDMYPLQLPEKELVSEIDSLDPDRWAQLKVAALGWPYTLRVVKTKS